MKAFHNDIKIKEKYVSRVLAHQKADNIIQGTGWVGGKGCAVGCTLENYNHAQYETELGVPEWLARLEDHIFEGLEKKDALKWPAEFLQAINVGSDLNKIKIPMLIFIVESARENFNHKKFPKQLAAIDGVLVELKRDVIDNEKLRTARRAAAYAAYADAADAAYAAYTYVAASVAYAAYAAYADAAYAAYTYAAYTYVAASVAYAAYATYADADAAYTYAAAATTAATATKAADAAAYAAAYATAGTMEESFKKFANKLLELMRECK